MILRRCVPQNDIVKKSFWTVKEQQNIGGSLMKVIKTILGAVTGLFVLTVIIYWFNLDTKVVKLIEKPMMQHYDTMKRDSRL